MSEWLPAVAAIVAAAGAIIASVVTGRSALAAQRLQVEQAAKAAAAANATAAEDSAGKLALAIALATRAEHRETRGRLDAHEEWREELVNRWLPEHEERDRRVEREVQKLDPTFVPPPWAPLPRLKRYVPPPENNGG